MEDNKTYIEKAPTPDIVPLQLSYGTYVSLEDYMKVFNEWNRLRDENARLKQWDVNKDSRNSRQRQANKKLLQKIEDLQEQITEFEFLVGLRMKRSLITKFDMMYSHEKVKEYKKQGRTDICGVMPDAEEVYRRYFTYKDGVESTLKCIEQMKIDNVDARSIVKLIETNLISIQKEEKDGTK